MSDDLVVRLRARAETLGWWSVADDKEIAPVTTELREAADEIERLRAERDSARDIAVALENELAATQTRALKAEQAIATAVELGAADGGWM
jgi:predicted  nucleic acid-binding Zn-ribbon protein